MIAMKVIVGVFLFIALFAFFYHVRKNRIIETNVARARDSLKAASAERMKEEHLHLGNPQVDVSKKGWAKWIEKPNQMFVYSRIGKLVKGMTFEIWAVLLVLFTAVVYFASVFLSKNPLKSLLIAGGFFLCIKMVEFLLARKNYKIIDHSLLAFLNQLGNFSAIQGELTGVLRQTARYMPPILGEALEECCIEAQMSGNVSVALMELSNKFEHEKFKEIITNLDVCTRYTANLKIVVDSLRKNLMDNKRASQERKSVAEEAVVETSILSVFLLIMLILVNQLIEVSIWQVLFHTIGGYIALGIAGISYGVLLIAVMKEQ